MVSWEDGRIIKILDANLRDPTVAIGKRTWQLPFGLKASDEAEYSLRGKSVHHLTLPSL